MTNKKIKTTILHAGYRLSVKQADGWTKVGEMFPSKCAALQYGVKHYGANGKVHVEGVRVDATPLGNAFSSNSGSRKPSGPQ